MPDGKQSKQATKDCRKCNRRRIKCDRSLPGCQKCHSRSFDCPGYGMILKWCNGASSRGHPKEKALHIRDADIEGSVSPATELMLSEDVKRQCSSDSPASSIGSQSMLVQRVNCESTNEQLDILVALYPPPVPDALQRPMVRRLLYHYDQFLAPQLAWIDSFENPWRNIILPMALESPSLLSSVLASAAGDLAKRKSSDPISRGDNLLAFNHYRDKALALSAEHLKLQALQPSDDGPSNPILAAIFLLCYHEMKWPQSGLWLVHLRAARSVVTCWIDRPESLTPTSQDSTRTFLIQEFFGINAIADVTKFDETSDHDILYDAACSDRNAIFIGYLRIVRHITRTERRQLAHAHLSLPLDIETLHVRLSQAHEHAVVGGQTLKFRSTQARRDFDQVLGIFYHSVLIYGYRVVLPPDEADILVTDSRVKLFEHLRELKDIEPFAQEMAWPVFVAGTECRGRVEDQICVEERLAEIMRINGPLDRERMLDFLKQFWIVDDGNDKSRNWIEVARGRAQIGMGFVVF